MLITWLFILGDSCNDACFNGLSGSNKFFLANKSVKYEVVMDVMAKLKENGVKRVGLAVKSQ